MDSPVFLKVFLTVRVLHTHSLGIEVVFDREAVDHAGGEAALHAGQDQQRQGEQLEVHPGRTKVDVIIVYLQFFRPLPSEHHAGFSTLK